MTARTKWRSSVVPKKVAEVLFERGATLNYADDKAASELCERCRKPPKLYTRLRCCI